MLNWYGKNVGTGFRPEIVAIFIESYKLCSLLAIYLKENTAAHRINSQQHFRFVRLSLRAAKLRQKNPKAYTLKLDNKTTFRCIFSTKTRSREPV